MKWAKENQVITNAEKFKEVFGIHYQLKVCDCLRCKEETCDSCSIKSFWTQEYKGDNNNV